MSNIAIKGADTGTGVFTLESPATDTDRTLVLPDEAGTMALQGGAGVGKVLQVVQGYTTSGTTTTSGTAVDTSLSATITPTNAASKILVLMSSNFYVSNSGVVFGDAYFYMVRGTTQLTSSRAGINFGGTSWADMFPAQQCFPYLDSPATTSEITYKMQISVSNSLSLTTPFQSFATMTLMEIAA